MTDEHSTSPGVGTPSPPPGRTLHDSFQSLEELDQQILDLMHSIDSRTTSNTVISSPALPTTTLLPATVLPSSRPSSRHTDSLRDRQLRADVLLTLTAALLSHGLLSPYQHLLLTHALHSYTPRYLQLVDSFLQAEKSYLLALRAQAHTPSLSPSASWAPPPPPTSLCNATGTGVLHPSSLPLSSLLSSSTSFRPFSPSNTLHHLLTSALLHSLDEVYLASFMSLPTSAAKKLSKAERAALRLTAPSLVYGEVTLAALAGVLWGLRRPSGGVFVDLGSGSGKGVVGALLVHDWDEVRGVEVLEGLWKASMGMKEKVERERRGGVMGGVSLGEASDGDGVDVGGGRRTRVVLERGSFFDVDWADADVVLANSTCFDEALVERLARRGQKLKQGAHCQPHASPRIDVCVRRISVVELTAAMAVCGNVWGVCSHHVHQEAVVAALPVGGVVAVRHGRRTPPVPIPRSATVGQQSLLTLLPFSLLLCPLQSWGLATAHVHVKVTPAQEPDSEADVEEITTVESEVMPDEQQSGAVPV